MAEIVLAATFPDPRSASIAAGMLRANGVECILDNAEFASILPLGDGPVGAVRLMVLSSQLARAKELLREHGDLD